MAKKQRAAGAQPDINKPKKQPDINKPKKQPDIKRGPRVGEIMREPRFGGTYQHRVLIGTPTLGTVRIEWHNAVNGLVIPTNWGNSTQTPIGFRVDDGQNLIVREAIQHGFEWLILLEDDVVPPVDLLQRFLPYIEQKTIPIVSGLYHLKGGSGEPLMYRGRGTGAYRAWKPGATVWVDGVPTGCLLVHASILRILADRAETYVLQVNDGTMPLRRVFWSPRMAISDPALPTYQKLIGTSDLWFCDQIIKEGILALAGWKKLAKRTYPFLVDTRIRCGHIDRNTGQIF